MSAGLVHFPPQDPASPLPRIVVRGAIGFYANHWLDEGCAIMPLRGEVPGVATGDAPAQSEVDS